MSPASDLTPAVFHILLALSERPLHGLGIAEEVDRITRGEMRLGPGTLYRSLKGMTEEGMIEETDMPDGADPRRKYHRITRTGRRALEEEARRLERLVDAARARNALPERA